MQTVVVYYESPMAAGIPTRTPGLAGNIRFDDQQQVSVIWCCGRWRRGAGARQRMVRFCAGPRCWARRCGHGGQGPGDVVALCGRNCLRYSWVVLGVLKAGAACQLLHADCTARELLHLTRISRPRLAACSAEVARRQLSSSQTVGELLAGVTSVQEVLVWGDDTLNLPSGCMPIHQFLSPCSEILPRNTSKDKHVIIDETSEKGKEQQCDYTKQVSFVLCSSGTTGLPKGVMLTHSSVIAALVANGPKFVSHNDVVLGLMPFCHAYGLCLMLMYLCRGARTVILDRFEPDAFSQIIPQYQISCLHLVPSLLSSLCRDRRLSGADLRSVCHLWTGASHVSPDMQAEVRARLSPHAVLHHSYGMTETTFTVLTGERQLDKLFSSGTLSPGMQCKVVDVKSSKVLGPKEPGELYFRGPLLTKGYMHNEKATQEAIDVDGWLHSGDLGYYDEDGYFYIVDRLKEIIKYQGYQISPSELESILITHPAVKEAAVVGVPHKLYGEVPQAYVVRQPGTNAEAQEIEDYLNGEAKVIFICAVAIHRYWFTQHFI
ncbi:hypothetical protein PR048_003812 [Dryococelus australis]|uniref:Uncharacterized protein n=1 Tax=Dryococelus australis TaxID=614101 RepID=A0ABQ9IP49_9NEOP|nr:hypothetical protein PR048_003812 [Dryococelus australis]